MNDAVLQQLRAGYRRLAAGDPDSFAEVLDPDVHWRGVVSGVFASATPTDTAKRRPVRSSVANETRFLPDSPTRRRRLRSRHVTGIRRSSP